MTTLHALLLAVALGQSAGEVEPPASPTASPPASAEETPPEPRLPPPRLIPLDPPDPQTPPEPRLPPPRLIPLDPPDPQAPPEPRLPPPRLIPLEGPDPQAKPPPPALVPAGAPALRHDLPSRCLERAVGGRWRAQCDASSRRCLFAPDAELSAGGVPVRGLERAAPCLAPALREDELAGQGYELVAALAESPPGWRRDERQRIAQVSFDLHRRAWLGAGYAPGGFPWSDAAVATAGVRWSVPLRLAGATALARVRAVETHAGLDGDHLELTLAGAEVLRAFPSPLRALLRLVGRHGRDDPPLLLGLWVEAARFESLRTGAGSLDRTGVAAAGLAVDLWRSTDLDSFARVRGGAGYERARQLDGAAWVPQAALDVDLALDRGGAHHLRATALAEWLVTVGGGDLQPEDPAIPRLPSERARYTAKAEYEVILAAVRDWPVSAVLELRAQRRNDVPGLSHGWHAQGTASLRLGLFAPPRREARPQERL